MSQKPNVSPEPGVGKNPFPTAPRPSIGRIVIYREAGPTEKFPNDTVVDEPAIIRGVNEDGTVKPGRAGG